MDLAQMLIRSVARAFYDTKHVLVIDALMIHSALPSEDLALLLGMQQKDLRKLCGKLKEDRLLAVHSRQETREGQQRFINKDYYYIDFHGTIDAIKYRIYHLTKQVMDSYKPNEAKKEYQCPRCRAEYTQMDVLSHFSPMGEFLCQKCDSVLNRDDTSASSTIGHERQSKLMSQLAKILEQMRKIDDETIPKNDFETALSLAVPIQRDETINPVRKMEATDQQRAPLTGVKGMTIAAMPLEVSLTTGSEQEAADKAEAARKAALAAQNALPDWHTTSTVTGQSITPNNPAADRLKTSSALLEPVKEEDDKKANIVLHDELAAYYAQMAQEKEKEAREEESTSADDDDDNDEFEDVGIGAFGAATPSSSMSGAANGSTKPSSLSGPKRKLESDSGSSAPGTSFSTPAASGTVAADEAPAKRPKLEPQTNGRQLQAAESFEKPDSDEDEEGEFEDVL